MVAAFQHLEVIGPRADLDAWLASLQDAGACHFADAMHDLEGEPGIGRPSLEAEEVHAELVRSEAARALRAVERVLPASPTRVDGERRPHWTMGPGGVGERELLELKDEARGIAEALRAVLERARQQEERALDLDGVVAALRALRAAGAPGAAARILRLPHGARGLRRLERRLRALGAEVLAASGARGPVLVTRGAAPSPAVAEAAAALGAHAAAVPGHLADLPLEEACARAEQESAEAHQAESEARAALQARVAEHGERARFLLDSLEDAEQRTAVRKHLASTAHVAAARVYVRPEDEPLLRERLRTAHGEAVVVRPLAQADDEPSVPRRVAAVPFAALQGLRPARFGDVSPASVLALLTPIAAGVAWADVAGGLLLLAAGALLGAAASVGSPRRDTALLAQVGGFAALLLGVLGGRAFGALGAAWFGTSWAVAPATTTWLAQPPTWAAPFVGVLVVLGAASLLLAAWGAVLALMRRAQGHPERARAALLGALHYAVVAGLAAAAVAGGPPLGVLAWAAPLGALGVLLLAGVRRFVLRLCLELVGVLRLVAVAGGALLLVNLVLASWVEPDVFALVLGLPVLLVAALAVVADPAHLAMGVPYDLSLGGRRLSRPFEAFGRRARAAGDGGR